MRTIRDTIAGGITTLAELQQALQTAIQLEFSTIPPYLCAEWSINSAQDPSGVAKMIHGVVIQEMLHFGLACNMLTAIGGTPQVAQAGFVPSYPASGLPGGVQPGLIVDLLPLGFQALNTFMEIEYPETGLLVPDPDSIGAFYDTIAAGFQTVQPAIISTATQVTTNVGPDNLVAITSIADALNAINEIKDQGEGTSTSPDQGPFDPDNLAHYYTFAQIYYGKQLVEVNGQFQFAGPAITMPGVYSFSASNAQPDPSAAFNQTFTSLLTALEQCWTANGSIDDAIGTMFTLKTQGQGLIQQGIRPEFAFVSAAAATGAA